MTTVHPASRSRRGITLTEILISILIMGVGLVSLATLFPVGLERIRGAQRNIRAAHLVRSAVADVSGRNLLGTSNFSVNPWTPGRDPWINDLATGTIPVPIYRGPGVLGPLPGEGLPVALDPLWWAQVNAITPTFTPTSDPTNQARFASGIGMLRNDPTGGAVPSAHGLQRVTFVEFLHPTPALTPATQAHAAQVFATIDDLLMQTEGDTNSVAGGTGSPILPYLDASGNTYNDWTYTWMFTGRRTGPTSKTYVGDIVVFHNRQFGYDLVPAPPEVGGTTVAQAAGERVVEAVWGYGSVVRPFPGPGSTVGYSPQDRTVLLRWPASQPDPVVRAGNWIADVTYERSAPATGTKFYPYLYSGQRCIWYRVARRGDAEADPEVSGYRRMTVTLENPLQAKTLLNVSTGEPVYVNAAMINPYVVYVFPKVLGSQ